MILLLVLVPIALVLLTPLMIVQRYRAGTARRPARPWMVTLALVSGALSVVFFLATAAFTTIWVPHTFRDALAGLGIGAAGGVLALLLTKWEATPRSLHYTPNRWLVLVITLLVSARIVFGIYRSVTAAREGLTGAHLLTSFGVAESLGAAGVVIGYYLIYQLGLRWRIRRWQRRALRVMN